MTVTIKDVAREANVSVATVSRALNGQHNVAEAVRRRIQDVAQRLRYTPHHAARSLSSRRTRTIGVVLPEVYGEFFSELMYGIDQVAREHGLHLLVSSYHGDPRQQGDALRSQLGDAVRFLQPQGGMFIWVHLTGANGKEKDGDALAKRAIEQGVAFVPGAPFFAQNPDRSTLRLSFATADIPKIEEGIARLAKAF